MAARSDDALLGGLGVAYAFRTAQVESGRVPTFILNKLKEGPAKHIKNNAYKYQKKLDREIARIRRIQTLQQRGVALSGTAIASAMISLGTLAARVAYTYIFCTEGEPCNA